MCYVLHHCRSLQLCAARAFKYIGRQYFMFLKERCVRDIWIYFGSRIGIRSCGHVHVMCQVVSVPTPKNLSNSYEVRAVFELPAPRQQQAGGNGSVRAGGNEYQCALSSICCMQLPAKRQ